MQRVIKMIGDMDGRIAIGIALIFERLLWGDANISIGK